MDLPVCGSETIAGLILHHLARIPVDGMKINIGEWRIIIQKATPKKIDKIKMKRLSSDNPVKKKIK